MIYACFGSSGIVVVASASWVVVDGGVFMAVLWSGSAVIGTVSYVCPKTVAVPALALDDAELSITAVWFSKPVVCVVFESTGTLEYIAPFATCPAIIF